MGATLVVAGSVVATDPLAGMSMLMAAGTEPMATLAGSGIELVGLEKVASGSRTSSSRGARDEE